MIRTYKVKQYSNKGKEEQIRNVFSAYHQSANLIAKIQWNLYYTDKHQFNKFYKSNINSKLSARYIQTCQYQVVGMLKSYISNVQNRFVDIVKDSTLDEQTKIKLFYINKYEKYFNKEVIMQKEEISQDIIFLSRKIFHHLTKHKPSFNDVNLALDEKVADITENNGLSSFDYWIKLSTLTSGHPIHIPIESNNYFDSKIGKLNKFCQINMDRITRKLNISLIKDIEKRKYIPLTPKIGIDIGLKILFSTSNGDMFGNKFYKKLIHLDNLTMKLQKELQKQKIPLRTNKKYNNLANIKRNFVKNEINKALNRLIEIYSPKEIVLENLYFNNPNLSRQMNRMLKTFGKRQIEQKLACLSEEFDITIIKVNPAYTSQECSSCGYVEETNRKSQSDFLCKACGARKHADVNAGKNVLARSSCKELSDIYISRKIILDRLIKRFIERKASLCSKAKHVIDENKYFVRYVQNNSVCNVCI